jgi:hypothetical protein
VRLEPDAIRVQVLTIVAQQPAVDVTFSIRELTELRLVRQVQWAYTMVGGTLAVLIGASVWPREREISWPEIAMLTLFAPSLFGLLAWLSPRNLLRIASQDSQVEIDMSTFSRRRVQKLVDAVRELRPDLEREQSNA